ncbi:MAG: DUF4416 family protein [Candidatus Omnitrophota bacterium]|jgi:hypothetical protein|nr:MAG: DUF4416 family protein [Candidatus Omnitrophota bacterium]
MGKTAPANPVKMFTGILYKNVNDFDCLRKILISKFGKIDYASSALKFDYTDYYEEEMGDGLLRVFFSFKRLIKPNELAKIKILTNKIEHKFSTLGKRRVNVDPGYLTLAKVILASTKDFSHRIYLDKGIFAELTLQYINKTFMPLPWTYPDYRTTEYAQIFKDMRSILSGQSYV